MEACFAPNWVRETVFRDRIDGELKVACTGADGRLFYVGNTNKSLKFLKEGEGKFSSPWNSAHRYRADKRKAQRFSYLCAVVAQCGLSERSIKPFVRLSSQFWKLRYQDFNRLIKHLVALNSNGNKVRRTSALNSSQTKPTLRSGVKVLKSPSVSVPLWGMRDPLGPLGNWRKPGSGG